MGRDSQDELIQNLLARTSRTFALAIPLLPFPAQREVSVAYLLLRIADTIEDAELLDRDEKLAAFDSFGQILDGTTANATLDLARAPCDNPDYLELLEELPSVLQCLSKLRDETRTIIVGSVQKSVSGMRDFVASGESDGAIRLTSLDQVRDYCYFVAGTVGEMLTGLFIANAPWLGSATSELHDNARWFGEGLQLVNIVKDAEVDAANKRSFIPADVETQKLFDLAREDLQRADAFVKKLTECEAPVGIIAFTDVPLQLAWRALECVEESGPGSKVPKEEVFEILARATNRLMPPTDPSLQGLT